jgi:hypothetical protein
MTQTQKNAQTLFRSSFVFLMSNRRGFSSQRQLESISPVVHHLFVGVMCYSHIIYLFFCVFPSSTEKSRTSSAVIKRKHQRTSDESLKTVGIFWGGCANVTSSYRARLSKKHWRAKGTLGTTLYSDVSIRC